MFEIKSLDELKNTLVVPVLFYNGKSKVASIVVTFYDLAQSTKHSETLNVSLVQDAEILELTFAQLRKIIDSNSANRLDEFLANVLHDSNLYLDTLHRIELDFIFEDSTSTALQRHFVIPSIGQVVRNTIVQTNVQEKGIAKALLLIHEQELTSVQKYVVLKLKHSDIVLFNDTKTDMTANFWSHSFSIANYDIEEIQVYAIGRFTNGDQRLLNYVAAGQTLVLIPQITFNREQSQVNGNRKSFKAMLEINANAFDGLHYINYASMFYRNGFSMTAKGPKNAVMQVSKFIGSESI